ASTGCDDSSRRQVQGRAAEGRVLVAVIVLLALACHSTDRFADRGALQRTMAALDHNHDGIVAVDELPDPLPDRDGDGTLSLDELRTSLDVDPWSVHADE